MKILCIGYRKWAIDIYESIALIFENHNFQLVSSVESYDENEIYSIKPDLILWYGWSNLVSEKVISNFFSVMLHPSPLPKYRGGSPIQNQIINGETEGAVTIFKMNNEVDEGDIIYQDFLSLEGDLNKILNDITVIGIELTKKMILNFDNLDLKKQDNSVSSYFPRRKPSESEITHEELINSSATQLHNKIRALQDPYPNAYILDNSGKKLFITKTHL